MANARYKTINFSPIAVYLIVSLSGIILFFIMAFFRRVSIFDWIMMENNSNFATLDYFRHVHHSQYLDKIYFLETDTYFPPLAYMFYYYIYKISYGGFYNNDFSTMLTEPYQIIIFIMYTIVAVIWLSYIIEEIETSGLNKKLLLFSIIFSVPMFAGAIERGNMVLFVVVMLLNAIAWKDSENRWKREMSLIFIAIASGLKVYPAVFGLLYIKEKRWKEAFRLMIYGVIGFFAPFIFFGGIKGVISYVKILMQLMSREYFGRVQFFKGLLSFTTLSNDIISVLNLCFVVGLLVAAFFTRDKVREMIFLSSFMAFVPGNAYRYTLSYFIIVLFVLFRNSEVNRHASTSGCTTKDKSLLGALGIPEFRPLNRRWTSKVNMENTINVYIYAIFLGAIFSIPTIFGIITDFRLNFGIYTYTYVERYIYTLAWGLLCFAVWIELYILIKRILK